jgi:hypothetical protein
LEEAFFGSSWDFVPGLLKGFAPVVTGEGNTCTMLFYPEELLRHLHRVTGHTHALEPDGHNVASSERFMRPTPFQQS